MLNKLLLLTTLLFLSGCGGAGGQKDRVMEIGESYSVSKGDVIVKASDVALIKVIHVAGEETSTVSLQEGNATITHPKESK